ncbi:hypothetical protein AVEN_203149-1 [Araneus ventricosus]|uniref:Uncharacterized protein n=1 Tax=Araneus ventricosus TaxID=182803 RepID=A0A4Y2CIK1_ARAVE|nr:hypothetical protein AVEN_203149-1 [Araneus ventricosus]
MQNVFKVRTVRVDTIAQSSHKVFVTSSGVFLLMLANESVMDLLRLKGLSASCTPNLSYDPKERNRMDSDLVNKVADAMRQDCSKLLRSVSECCRPIRYL